MLVNLPVSDTVCISVNFCRRQIMRAPKARLTNTVNTRRVTTILDSKYVKNPVENNIPTLNMIE